METMSVDIGLESLDGQVDTSLRANTSERLTGELQVVDWSQHARRWRHLKELPFPSTNSIKHVGILIGLDNGQRCKG